MLNVTFFPSREGSDELVNLLEKDYGCTVHVNKAWTQPNTATEASDTFEWRMLRDNDVLLIHVPSTPEACVAIGFAMGIARHVLLYDPRGIAANFDPLLRWCHAGGLHERHEKLNDVLLALGRIATAGPNLRRLGRFEGLNPKVQALCAAVVQAQMAEHRREKVETPAFVDHEIGGPWSVQGATSGRWKSDQPNFSNISKQDAKPPRLLDAAKTIAEDIRTYVERGGTLTLKEQNHAAALDEAIAAEERVADWIEKAAGEMIAKLDATAADRLNSKDAEDSD